MNANSYAYININIVSLFRLNRLPLAKMEEIIELNASKMQQQGSVLDYFSVADRF